MLERRLYDYQILRLKEELERKISQQTKKKKKLLPLKVAGHRNYVL